MAKNRTLNEIRQSKEFQQAKSTKEAIADQQAINRSLQAKKEKVITESNEKLHYATRNPFNHKDVDKTVNEIIENLDGHIYDLIFQAVCDEMNEHYVFDSSEYLTESGLELFEDEWFEFYHENHGKIIHKLIQKLK